MLTRRPPPGRSRTEGVQSRPGSGSGTAGAEPAGGGEDGGGGLRGSARRSRRREASGRGHPGEFTTDLLLLDDLLRRRIRSICRQTLEDGAAPGGDHG